jgi:hypothetical protein
MRRLFVAEPALVPRLAHLLLVAKPLQFFGRDVNPQRFRRGWWWMWGFGGHEAIVPVLGGSCAATRYLVIWVGHERSNLCAA